MRSHVCVPDPCGFPSTQSPSYFSPESGHDMTPRPFFWSHAHPPSYTLPDVYRMEPVPCFWSSRHSPWYRA